MRYLTSLASLVLRAPEGDAPGGSPPPPADPAKPPPPAPPPSPQPDPKPAPAAASVDLEAVKAEAAAEARAKLLAEFGIKDPAEAKEALEAKRKAEEAKLSDAERTKRALDAAAAAQREAEERAKEVAAENAKLQRQVKDRDVCDARGVAPKSRDIVLAYLDVDRARKGKDFDEKRFFEDLAKEHPGFFAEGGAAAPVNTSLPGGARPPAAPNGSSGTSVDVMKMTKAEYDDYRRKNGLSA